MIYETERALWHHLIGAGSTGPRHWIDSHILERMAALAPAELMLGWGFCPERSRVFSIWNHAVKTFRNLAPHRFP